MREIKFRAWNEQIKCMSKTFSFGQILNFNDVIYRSLTNESIMQYTGFKDKNGVEIYEGDIVHYDGKPFNVYALKATGVIRWFKGAWTLEYKASYKTNDGRDVFNQYHLGCEDFFHKKSVILGNIHESPELLK